MFVIVHTPRGIQLHLSVIGYKTGDYSFICLLLSIHPGNTAPFVCYFSFTHGNTASCVF